MTLNVFDELHEKKVAALDVALTSLERANRLLCSSFLRAAIEQCNLARVEEEADWRNYHDVHDRAAELPLEPTAPTTAADNYRSDEDIPGVVDDIEELWS